MLDGCDVNYSKAKRVARGLSWGSTAGNCTVVNQSIFTPTSSYSAVGFRVVLSSVP